MFLWVVKQHVCQGCGASRDEACESPERAYMVPDVTSWIVVLTAVS